MSNRNPSAAFVADPGRPIEIAPGVWWVGFYDAGSGLHCNPYLVVDGDEAVVIDGGSRPDFPKVMTKILQTGTDPSHISALFLSHYDPDVCGSVGHFEDLIGRDNLLVLSHRANHMFIRHVYMRSQLTDLDAVGGVFRFRSGRTLSFHGIPYCHAPGAAVALDEQSGVLFTSDLFGSVAHDWQVYLDLSNACRDIRPGPCEDGRAHCPLHDIQRFHEGLMPSRDALRHSLGVVGQLPFRMLAPQHGSVIRNADDIVRVFEALYALECVGFERVAEAASVPLRNAVMDALRHRLAPR